MIASCTATQESRGYPITAVPFTSVKLTDSFWQPRIETNRTATIPHCFAECEETGRIENFAFAGGLKEGVHNGGYCFNDSDVYKTIEGAAFSLAAHPDPELEKYVDGVIEQIAAAQEDDGYLYTARTALNPEKLPPGGKERWSDVRWGHELYCVGHLYEAAVAYYQATGKRNLLDVALKSADLVLSVFGPDGRTDPPGHQEIEIGLVKLYKVTGEKKYLDQAELFLERRGRFEGGRESYGEYAQDHMPVAEQDEAVGHAVRAAYMYSGMADVASLTDHEDYIAALKRLWEATAACKLYLTGGIGAQGSGEAFSGVYELPNMSAYAETCASIANVFWNHRMFLLTGDSKYLDVLERILYNAALAGVSMDGKAFFYPNPLESVGQHERTPWFNCACCPPNVARFIASMPGYFYATAGDKIFVNLYAAGTVEIELGGKKISLAQETRYPWDGAVRIAVEPEADTEFALSLRIPGWSQGRPIAGDLYSYMNPEPGQVTLKVNGEAVPLHIENGFAEARKTWKSGDAVELELPMPIHRVLANEKVAADLGRVALERGPLVFCAEWPDNEGGHVRNLMLPDDGELTTEFAGDLLGGVQVIRGRAVAYEYRDQGARTEKHEQQFTAIPYYAWANRGKGEMAVWLAREESTVHPLNEPTLASTSKVTASSGRNPEAVNDQLEPTSSNDGETPKYYWWPNKGTTEWIQYDFEGPKEVSIVEVYWFDDSDEGECRVPQSWRILYKDGEDWRPVYSEEGVYGVEKDRFNRVVFETVRTTAVRLEIQSQPEFAGGIYEWKIK